jgi:long-chain fatty acid transport protein
MQRPDEFCSAGGQMALFGFAEPPTVGRMRRRADDGDSQGARVEGETMATRAPIKAAVLTGAALGAIGLGANTAQAGGFFVHEQSTYFQGTSFAGAAAGGPALSAMFWNPATITQQGLGLSTEVDATAVFPRSDVTPVVATSVTGANLVPLGSSGDIGKDAFVPASYYVYGLNNLITIGFGLNAPFGLRTQPNPLWAGMFYSRESEVFSLNATPTVAFKLTDWLSVGVGAQIQYLKVKLHSAFPGSGINPLLPDPLRIDGDSFDYGFTAGVTITPTAWTTIGLGYRSRIDHSLEGDIFRPFFITTAPPPLPPVLVGVPPAFVNFEADVPLPDIATVSIRQKITESFTLLGTVEWQNWSRLGTIPVAITSTPVIPLGIPNALAFEWRDGWLFSGGFEYQWSPKLALRGGVGFERSPIDERTRGTRLPDNDRLWVSAGATYNWTERLSVELGYSHIFVDEAPINLVPGNPTFNPALGTFIGIGEGQVDIISVALRYRLVPPPAPVVTKG